MSEAHCNNLVQRKALGLVTHDNTGGPFVVECHGCGSVYPSFQCSGGGQIADTGDYDDARCPHCQHVDPEECGNVGLVWNTQQLKINALQLLLNERDEQVHSLEQRRQAEQQACQAAERRVQELQATLKDLIGAVGSINRSPAYKVTVIGDDEPQYRQRKEWIDWVLELCDQATAGMVQPAPVAVELADRSPENYAIEHAEYMAQSADGVLAKFQAYGVALLAVDEGGDDGEGELFDAIDSARGDLQESLVDLRSMVHEFRKRSNRCKSL